MVLGHQYPELTYKPRKREGKINLVDWTNTFQGHTRMSERSKRPAEHVLPPEPSLPTARRDDRVSNRSAPKAKQSTDDLAVNQAIRAELKCRLDETRLPAELREQILAGLPSPEEQQRLYREMQENGGLASQEFLDSLAVSKHQSLA